MKRSGDIYKLLLRFIPIILILFFLNFSLTSCNPGSSNLKKPQYVIFISIDTLRADHLGCYGYAKDTSPVIDSIAKEGTLFENTFCQRGITLPSLASIMTGKYINRHLLIDNVWSSVLEARNKTLAEYLKESGYYNRVFSSNFIVTAETGVLQGFNDVTVEIDEEKSTETAISWLNGFVSKNQDKKLFLWMHYFDPHTPYEAREPYFSKFENVYTGNIGRTFLISDTAKVFNEKIELTNEDKEHLNALYDSQIARVDVFIGEIVEELKKLGIYDKTLFVFFADHGEEIYGHNYYIGHFCSVYNDVLHIPLIIRYPEIIPQNKRIEQVTESIDIMPTVMDLCKITPDEEINGLSLKPLWEGKEFKKDFAVSEYWNLIFKINTGEWTYIWNPTKLFPQAQQFESVQFNIGEKELYNIKNDPNEQTNLIGENQIEAESLHKKLEKWIRDTLDRDRWPDKEISKEEINLKKNQEHALRSLGYLK